VRSRTRSGREKKEPIDGGHTRLAAGSDGREVENLHAGQLVDQALCVEPGVLAPDPPKVRTGALIAPVEEALQLLQLRGGLVHRLSIIAAAEWATAIRPNCEITVAGLESRPCYFHVHLWSRADAMRLLDGRRFGLANVPHYGREHTEPTDRKAAYDEHLLFHGQVGEPAGGETSDRKREIRKHTAGDA